MTMLGILLAVALSQAPAIDSVVPEPTEAEFKEQAARLDAGKDAEIRSKAVRWLNSNSGSKHALLAAPALERCIRRDPEWKLRSEAVLALAHIMKHADQPCPLVQVEAILDQQDEVRWQAMACLPFFKSFEPGAVAALLPGVKSLRAEVREDCLLALGRVAGKDRQALAAMELAKQDKIFQVRHAAHLALFHARDKLEEHLPYLILLREDPAAVLAPVPEDEELANRERTYRNLVSIGSSIQLIEWNNSRADELAQALSKLMAHQTPLIRRGAIHLIAASLEKVKPLPKRDPLELGPLPDEEYRKSLFKLLNPDAAEKPKPPDTVPPVKSAVAWRLEKLGTRDELKKLSDSDPDESVRIAAIVALERWASLEGKSR